MKISLIRRLVHWNLIESFTEQVDKEHRALCKPFYYFVDKFSIICSRNLPNTDIFDGSPDPYIEVLQAEGSSSDLYVKVGETVPLSNTNNPDWKEIFQFNFVVGANQVINYW